MFEYLEIPLDNEDYRYVQSFAVEEADDQAVQDFFTRYGFVVFRDVISREECAATLDDMWTLWEETTPGLDRTDTGSWSKGWSSFGMPKNTKSHVLFRPSLLRLRQHERLVRCFRGVLEEDDIVCNHDRCLMHRPTQLLGRKRSDWATKPNVHLDLNPREFFDSTARFEVYDRLSKLRYGARKNRAFVAENNDVHYSMGRSVQGILNLTDLPSTTDGGGTIVIPGSQQQLESLVAAHLIEMSAVGPTQHTFGPDTLKTAQRVCMRPGSLLIWDQRLVHGSTVNRSSVIRCGIPVRFYSAQLLAQSKDRAQDRANTLRQIIREEGFESGITELGRRVFGFHLG